MPLEVVRVSVRELRQLFDEHCAEDIREGRLQAFLVKEGHPAPRPSLPVCTRSQYIAFRDADGNTKAGVHQYLRPDNTLGGSGLQDPKRVVVGDRVYLPPLPT